MQNFDTWYAHRLAHFGPYLYECRLDNSPLTVARCAAPHSMLYFIIQVLQRLVHQFWDTAQQDSYVLECGGANSRCPPSIIAVLFYYECTFLSPFNAVSTKKRRLHTGSEAAASSGDAATAKAERDVFWQTFAEKRHAAFGLAGSVARRHSRGTKIRPRQSRIVDSGHPSHPGGLRGVVSLLVRRQEDGQEQLVPRVRSTRHI